MMAKSPRDAVEQLLSDSGVVDNFWVARATLSSDEMLSRRRGRFGVEAFQEDLVRRFLSREILVAEALSLDPREVRQARRLLIETRNPANLMVGALLTSAVSAPRVVFAEQSFANWPAIVGAMMSHESDDPDYDREVKPLLRSGFFETIPVPIVALPRPLEELTASKRGNARTGRSLQIKNYRAAQSHTRP